MNKRILIIAASIGILILLVMSLLLEFRNVPDYKWEKWHEFEEKDPSGYWLLGEMIKQSFGDTNVTYEKSDTLNLPTGKRTLLINAAQHSSYESSERDSLLEFVARGNTLLLLSSKLKLSLPYPDSLNYDGDSISDNLLTEDENEYENKSDSISYYNLGREIRFGSDSIIYFEFEKFDSTDASYSFNKIDSEFKNLKKFSFKYLRTYFDNDFYSYKYTPIGYLSDYRSFFGRIEYGDGQIYLHTIPDMFCNVYSKQDYYRHQYNEIISHLDADRVILQNKKHKFNFFDNSPKESPIQFILSTPSLKWAYYLTLFSLLLFTIFRSKRLQRIIPTIEKEENTSLQYINTISKIYQSQNQNNKLVDRIREVFLQKMKAKYYLDPNTDNFVESLSKKSKVKEEDINKILHKLNSARSSDFTDDQLIVLYKQIESFYKKSK